MNRYSHHDHHGHFDDDEGPFHVNAVKSKDGLWREITSGSADFEVRDNSYW